MRTAPHWLACEKVAAVAGVGLGARVATTTVDDASVAAAVHTAAGDGHVVEVVITPSPRHRGDLVTVTVVLQTAFGPFTPSVTAAAVGRGEPSLSEGH